MTNPTASNVIPFNFITKEIRVIEQDGELWFIAKDVAELLGYKRTADAIRAHCKGVGEIQTPINGITQTLKLIPERDVYRLIMRSKLPEAEKFEEWIVAEVLPSIRKSGGYGVQAIDWGNAEQVAGILSQSIEKVQEQRQLINALSPKADFHDKVIVAPEAISVAEAAKIIGTGRSRLFAFLRASHWITRHNEPYQAKIDSGHLNVKISKFTHPEQGLKDSITVIVTGKGLVALQKLWKSKEVAA